MVQARLGRLCESSQLSAKTKAGVERAARVHAFVDGPWFFFGPKWHHHARGTEDRFLTTIDRVVGLDGTLATFLNELETSTRPDERTLGERLSAWTDRALDEVRAWPSSFADSLDVVLADERLTVDLRSSLRQVRDETVAFTLWIAEACDYTSAWRILQEVANSDVAMRQALLAARAGRIDEAELTAAAALVITERQRNRGRVVGK